MIPINHTLLLNAADQLVNIEEEVEVCLDCVIGHMCLEHATQEHNAFALLRQAIGRPYSKDEQNSQWMI